MPSCSTPAPATHQLSWERARDLLANLMVGFASTQEPTYLVAVASLDAVTESPRMPLHALRAALRLSIVAEALPGGVEQPRSQPLDAFRFLDSDDLQDLALFNAQCEDFEADGHTIPKETMRRLIELGALRSLGWNRYGITAFGAWLVASHQGQPSPLPLRASAHGIATPATQGQEAA